MAAMLPVLEKQWAFGWDESVYALKGRAWLLGTPDTGWGPHRPLGLAAIAWAVDLLNGDETLHRVALLPFNAALLVAIWWLGRMVSNGWAGLLAASAMLANAEFLQRSGEFLNDGPSAAVLVLAVAVCWWQLERATAPRWPFLLVPVLLAASFWLRYGNQTLVLAEGFAAFLVWHKKLLRNWQLTAVALGVYLALMLPFAFYSFRVTGSVMGVPRAAEQVAARQLGAGLHTYASLYFDGLMGPLGAALVTIALFGSLWFVVRAAATRRAEYLRRPAILALPPLVHVLVIGTVAHGEPRYVFPAIALLFVEGAACLAGAAGALRSRLSAGAAEHWLLRALPALVTIILVVPAVLTATRDARDHFESYHREQEIHAVAGKWLREQGDGSNCVAVGQKVPQLTWYSGCKVYDLSEIRRPGLPDTVYLVAAGKTSTWLGAAREAGYGNVSPATKLRDQRRRTAVIYRARRSPVGAESI
jgi:hypothetical protein